MKKCDVYMRKCMSGDCAKHWDRSQSSVFYLIKITCAGYKLGIVIYVVDKSPVLIPSYGIEFFALACIKYTDRNN